MPLPSTRAMLPDDWKLIAHFKPAEFRYPERMGYQFMISLDRLRRQAGVPMHPTSGYRTPAHNKAVGGAKDSAHTDDPICDAVDIAPRNSADRYEIMRSAYECGWTRLGIYANGSLHFDTTGDRRPDRVLWVVVSNPA